MYKEQVKAMKEAKDLLVAELNSTKIQLRDAKAALAENGDNQMAVGELKAKLDLLTEQKAALENAASEGHVKSAEEFGALKLKAETLEREKAESAAEIERLRRSNVDEEKKTAKLGAVLEKTESECQN